MIKYNIKQTYTNSSEDICFNYFTLTIVKDKKIKSKPFRILNITSGDIWIPTFETYEDAECYLYSLPNYEVTKVDTTEKSTNILIKHQYDLPSNLRHLAERYPNVTWNQAVKLYECAVIEVIVTNYAENLYDANAGLNWGRGFAEACICFEELLKDANERLEEKKNDQLSKLRSAD